jgi:hypothetical protein
MYHSLRPTVGHSPAKALWANGARAAPLDHYERGPRAIQTIATVFEVQKNVPSRCFVTEQNYRKI